MVLQSTVRYHHVLHRTIQAFVVITLLCWPACTHAKPEQHLQPLTSKQAVPKLPAPKQRDSNSTQHTHATTISTATVGTAQQQPRAGSDITSPVSDSRAAAGRQLLTNPIKKPRLVKLDPETYTFLVPEYARQDGQLYRGSSARLRSKLRSWSRGANLTIATIGASITAGQGVVDGMNCTWPARLEALLTSFSAKAGYGAVNLANGGVPGATSMFMSVCLRTFVPEDVDVVIVEFASNDAWEAMRSINTEARRSFERMLRKLLSFPAQPAVLLLNTFAYRVAQSKYYVTPEPGYVELATYYSVPVLSMRTCCFHLMRQAVPGFVTTETRRERRLRNETDQQEQLLYFHDNIHPSGLTGHKAMAEVAWQMLDDVLRDAVQQQQQQHQHQHQPSDQELPPPMLPDNLESSRDSCMISTKLQSIVTEVSGFEWVNEAKATSVRPKWGYVGSEPGSRLVLQLSTEASAGTASQGVLLEVAHLKSYEGMGQGVFRCESGCKCEETVVEGHHTSQTSQTFLHSIRVSQSPQCVVSITVGPGSLSGSHKVKVVGIIVSEEGGGTTKQTSGVVGYSHDIATRDKDGFYDARNYA